MQYFLQNLGDDTMGAQIVTANACSHVEGESDVRMRVFSSFRRPLYHHTLGNIRERRKDMVFEGCLKT